VSTNAWESAETRRALAYPGDGLLDIFLGLTLLDAWTILSDPPGALSGGFVIVLFPLLLVAKRAITVPRLPQGDLSPGTPQSGLEKARGKSLPAVAFAAVVLVLLWIGRLWLPAPGRPGAMVWEIVVLAGIACVAAAGARIGARRFIVYAGLTGIALVPALHGRSEIGAHMVPILAAGMVAWGGVRLARFLTIRPRPA
jgi:hypothetical protein